MKWYELGCQQDITCPVLWCQEYVITLYDAVRVTLA